MVRKHIALTASATAITVAGLVGSGAAMASSSATQGRQVMQRTGKLTAAERETRYEERLTKAVSDNKITADQKTAILAEHQKLETAYTAAKAKTGDERKTAVRQVWSDAKAWAQTNKVNVRYLIGFRPHMRGADTAK